MNALIIVDVQNDFLPGGTLPVAEGNKVVPVINALVSRFDLVVATQDWHPRDHGSFAANHPGRKPGEMMDLDGLPQILWPVHCVQGTRGAEFAPGLNTKSIARIFQKGTDPKIDSYSGLFDNGHRKATGLGQYLKDQGATEVYVCGLATDYCVKFTALDAAAMGIKTSLIQDASRGVELKPGDINAAIDAMRTAGIGIVQSGEIPEKTK